MYWIVPDRRTCPVAAMLLVVASLYPLSAGCDSDTNAATTDRSARIATTNSYLEAAVLDVLGEREPVVRLAEPGMCPGHFDVRPSQIRELRGCELLLRFGFQQGLDRGLEPLTDDGLQIVPIETAGGLCEPATYLAVCQRVGKELTSAGLLSTKQADASLHRIERRLGELESNIRQQIEQAELADAPVASSFHQKAFCQWLGLNVVATLTAADTALVSDINDAIAAGEHAQVRYVIANRPEGRGLADALADRLGAKVVMFDNFPVEYDGQVSFDRLVLDNIHWLIADKP